MTRILTAFLAVLALASAALAQSPPFPQSMPPLSFVGNLSPLARPGTAIPLAALQAAILAGYTPVNDANYPAVLTDRTIVYTAISAARTVTLLPASTFAAGTRIYFLDASGNASVSNTVSLAPTGADLINGQGAGSPFLAVASAYGGAFAVSDGTSKWTVSVGGGFGAFVASIGGESGVIALGGSMFASGNTLFPAPSTPRMWQPQATNCDSGHQAWFVDENFCAHWGQSFVTNDDPSVLVAIPVAGTAGPTAASQTLTFTFGSGACVSGCAASYTFQAASITASISGTNLIVTALPGGATIQIGQAITGSGVTSGTVVTGPVPGQGTWNGGIGTYTVNHSQTVGSETLTATDTLNSIAWGLSNAIKANANLYNPTATTTSQQKEIIWSTANTSAPQISLDIDGRTALKIVATSAGSSTVTSTPPGNCPSSSCALLMDVGTFIQYSRSPSPSFVPAANSSIYQALFTGIASGGSGIYGQISVGVVDPTISLGSVFVSGQLSSGILAGVYVSKGLYSVSQSDHGADTAAFTSFIGTNFSGSNFGCTNGSLGTTTVDCVTGVNSTAAAAGAQQFSPDWRLAGQGWQTTTPQSEQVDWRVVNEPVQSTTHPTSNLTYNFQVNGGGYVREFGMASSGIFNANTGYTINGLAASGHTMVGNGSAYVDGSFAQIIPISNGTLAQAQNTTQFVLTLSNAAEAEIQALCPKGGTFKNLYVQSSAPASGQTITATWRVNGASTALTCTITGPSTTCNDTTHTAACTAGQAYSLQSVASATTGSITALDGGIEFDNP